MVGFDSLVGGATLSYVDSFLILNNEISFVLNLFRSKTFIMKTI